MKIFILLAGVLLLSGCSNLLGIGQRIPNCGEEYNNAFDLALKNKDLSFCLNKNYTPNTVIFDNGIIKERVCKNSQKHKITISNEACIGSFVLLHNQPQLCTVFDRSLFNAMSEEDKKLVYSYLKTDVLWLFSGNSLNCVTSHRVNKNSIKGCNYLNKEMRSMKDAEGNDFGWSDKEMCIHNQLFCDYEFDSPRIKYVCNHVDK